MDNKEKINENLEKIKQLCDVEVPYNEVCSIHANALGEIQEAAERMAAEIERLETADILSDEAAIATTKYIEELETDISRLKAEVKDAEESANQLVEELNEYRIENTSLKAELEKYKKESLPMKMKDQAYIENKCPDGIIRECCYDEKEHKFVPPGNRAVKTSKACSICAVLKEKVNYWKHQFDLEVVGRRKAETELEKRPEVIYCGTCKYYVPNENFCNAGLLGTVSPFDFCFRGQRRESEEGK